MSLKDIMGQPSVPGMEMEGHYDFEKGCICLFLKKYSNITARKFGIKIEIQPDQIEELAEGQMYPVFKLVRVENDG